VKPFVKDVKKKMNHKIIEEREITMKLFDQNKPELFVCNCGYESYRWNHNLLCSNCKQEGKLIELIEE
jgi:hypothetical protein